MAKRDPIKAAFFPRFFKAGKGEYAEGDKFLGVTVPEQRLIAKKFRDLPLKSIESLLKDRYHEVRLTALLILTMQYDKADQKAKKEIVDFYLSHLNFINNWDLVDASAYRIVGDWLIERDRSILYRFAKSSHLWTRRISIVSTYAFIRRGDLGDTFKIAEALLKDKHDLMHKAVGWMLREAGKRDQHALHLFLKEHRARMPRTMLRYAIERFPEATRRQYLLRDQSKTPPPQRPRGR